MQACWLALCGWLLGGLAQAAETIRYCDYPVYPPISWSDGQQVRGLAPELVKRLFGALGYRVEVVVLGNWRRCLLDAAAGRVDLILAYRTPARDRDLAFSTEPVLREDVAIFYNRQRPVRIQSLGDLAGYRGGLLFGESYGADFDRFVGRHGNVEWVSDSDRTSASWCASASTTSPTNAAPARCSPSAWPAARTSVRCPNR
ncbi:hypothetical protein PGPR2_28570 [Pseudomonas aeruginosa PGPR2]|nr:hypothetical protein PGPR2_28570 [Pseudomonas aeruginosa PGPR2]